MPLKKAGGCREGDPGFFLGASLHWRVPGELPWGRAPFISGMLWGERGCLRGYPWGGGTVMCWGRGCGGEGEVFWWLTGDYSQAPDPQSAHSNLPLKCSASSRAGICTGAGTAGGCRNEGR